MKKKWFVIIPVTIIISAMCALGIRALVLHISYSNPNQAYFVENYNEIFHITSIFDKKQAKTVLADLDNAFSFIGTVEEAKEKFGIIGKYSITNNTNESLTEEHDIKFVAADFKEETGYLWFEYTSKAYKNNGELYFGTIGVLSRLTLEKIDGEWVVIDTAEHP